YNAANRQEILQSRVESTHVVGEAIILTAPALRVIADLAGRRLTHVHERGPLQMVSGDLRAHRPAPHRRRRASRWRAADRRAPSPGPGRSALAGRPPVPRDRTAWAIVSVVDVASC